MYIYVYIYMYLGWLYWAWVHLGWVCPHSKYSSVNSSNWEVVMFQFGGRQPHSIEDLRR